MVFGKATDAEHAEAQDTPLFIDPLHDGIVRSRSHEAWSLSKLNFQVIGFRIKPNFYFFGHRHSPGFSWSVR
jgi:hypothetical protein